MLFSYDGSLSFSYYKSYYNARKPQHHHRLNWIRLEVFFFCILLLYLIKLIHYQL